MLPPALQRLGETLVVLQSVCVGSTAVSVVLLSSDLKHDQVSRDAKGQSSERP